MQPCVPRRTNANEKLKDNTKIEKLKDNTKIEKIKDNAKMTKSSANKHRVAQARAASEKFLFMLHCDGINIKDGKSKVCSAKIFVPMTALRSIEEAHLALKSVDWRVSFAKVPVSDNTARDAAFAQCTDCWIEFYKDMVKDSENKEELFAQIDPEGKFLDKLRGGSNEEAKE